MIKRLGPQAISYSCRRRPMLPRRCSIRKFTSHPSPAPAHPSSASPLGVITVELDNIAPRFEIQASQINILDSPTAFYEALKDKIRNAKRRIYLSTLYIGKTEYELIGIINGALRKNPELQVSILTDALRGTRETPGQSCASLLASLVSEHGPDRVEIRMFHTPNLTGLRKRIIPRRINEGWGLQHMKLYGIDNEIILSGANLSNDYFSNRVDRYHVFNSKPLTDYYSRIHNGVCSLSFQMLSDSKDKLGYTLSWPASNGAPSPLDDRENFISHASTVLAPLVRPLKSKALPLPASSKPTFVYPVAQFSPLLRPDESTEYPAVTKLLSLLSTTPALANSSWLFTAGYFNIHPVLSSLLISSTSPSKATVSKPQGTVLTASPWANGFYGSAGVSGMLPAAYTHLSARFLDCVAEAQRANSIQWKEWRRGTVGESGGWSYHAKGLWVTLPGEQQPSITFVGSSNFTKRSYGLDLEVGAIVVTSNEALKQRLAEETEWLQKDASVMSRDDLRKEERRVRWNVRLAIWIVEKVGGAL
ncbi:hypothetical protein PABG_06726 [Paracoccidioides brasiliensis Pb03]|uniref:CDP-diacylglycerol--glycerol-3-phosphate 3-phosphatidyltransferase n=1 Tax=Paracoccidioides brasiliensis TaxID=121759 RepID=A0A1D2JA03_PARBR|nr:hypothetical protein PABG_06726 [Paracoccidioides brasiliensis Pb03]ODH21793.1 hypothetical protein ACO22_05621 [Paracoccidioides brasiliensis]ODH51612.1 hypothetical protein GX48_02282 [Paracoccidioides brasiliensis]